jgi:hypothetical protein
MNDRNEDFTDTIQEDSHEELTAGKGKKAF